MDYTEIPALVPEAVRGILFDYGGTLDSHGDHWCMVIHDSYLEAGLDIGLDVFVPAYIAGERVLAVEGVVSPNDTFREMMDKKIRVQFRHLGLEDNALAERIVRSCYESARKCMGEVRTMLGQLSGRGYKLGLVSNFYGNLDAVIADFGISDFFDVVVESAKVGVRKPDPEIFRIAVDRLGFSPAETLVIGDSIDKDILPATTIGCPTLHLPGRPFPKL